MSCLILFSYDGIHQVVAAAAAAAAAVAVAFSCVLSWLLVQGCTLDAADQYGTVPSSRM